MKRKQPLEYIHVYKQTPKARLGHPSEKPTTLVYEIRLTDGKTSLGRVRWHNREHRYVFISNAGPVRIPKSSVILDDISRFIKMLMKERQK